MDEQPHLIISADAWQKRKCSKCGKYQFATGYGGETRKWTGYTCPTCAAAYQAERFRNLDNDAKERRRLYAIQYHADHADEVRARKRRNYAANPQKQVQRTLAYQKANPEVPRRAHRNWRARKAAAVCEHGPGCFDAAARMMPRVCTRCGSTSGSIHADHIIPLARGGPDCAANLQPLCASCNTSKGAR